MTQIRLHTAISHPPPPPPTLINTPFRHGHSDSNFAAQTSDVPDWQALQVRYSIFVCFRANRLSLRIGLSATPMPWRPRIRLRRTLFGTYSLIMHCTIKSAYPLLSQCPARPPTSRAPSLIGRSRRRFRLPLPCCSIVPEDGFGHSRCCV